MERGDCYRRGKSYTQVSRLAHFNNVRTAEACTLVQPKHIDRMIRSDRHKSALHVQSAWASNQSSARGTIGRPAIRGSRQSDPGLSRRSEVSPNLVNVAPSSARKIIYRNPVLI